MIVIYILLTYFIIGTIIGKIAVRTTKTGILWEKGELDEEQRIEIVYCCMIFWPATITCFIMTIVGRAIATVLEKVNDVIVK